MNIIYPGRFQPPHYGHIKKIVYIKKIFGKKPKILVLKNKKTDFYNPLNYEEVFYLIKSYQVNCEIDFLDSPFDILKKVKKDDLIITGSTKKHRIYQFFGKNSLYLPRENFNKKEVSSTKIKILILEGEYEKVLEFINEDTLYKLLEKKKLGVLQKNMPRSKLEELIYSLRKYF